MKAQHFLMCATSTQFSLPTKETYNTLIEMYKINEMQGFKQYEELQLQKIKHIYNPQKTPGKPWKVKEHNTKKDVYGQSDRQTLENISGDRHPKSVLKFHQCKNKLHPTQKPLELCEWLIKTYSNDNDVILDFCMGSGTTIQACMNTNRQYIGVEKDKDIYETAKKRLNI
jgi:DNA modification methylase